MLLPCTLAVLFILLSFMYGLKNAFRISISPVLGILFTVGILSLFGESLNLFHILGLFLIAGFSLDYSIFRLNCGEGSKDAVFMSAASTAFSFLLLSFTGFKLVSSIGITLFIGITVSYILSLIMVKVEYATPRTEQIGKVAAIVETQSSRESPAAIIVEMIFDVSVDKILAFTPLPKPSANTTIVEPSSLLTMST